MPDIVKGELFMTPQLNFSTNLPMRTPYSGIGPTFPHVSFYSKPT